MPAREGRRTKMNQLTGLQLKQLRTGLRLTAEKVAEAAGLSRPYLSMIENGGAVPERYVDPLLDALDDLAADCGEEVSATHQRIRDLKRRRGVRPSSQARRCW